MARLTRYTQKLFGSTAGANQMAEYGSLANAAPATYSGATITPAIVQNLSQYLSGWFAAVIGSQNPTIEDMNALCYLFGYQLSYMMQSGVPEWDSATEYFIGNIVQNGAGILYASLTNSNVGNPVSDTANWGAPSFGGAAPISSINQLIITYSMSPFTYSPPNNLVQAQVEILGGGGNGGFVVTLGADGPFGGGAGAYSKAIFTKDQMGTSVLVTIGAGGISANYPSPLVNGGDSSFGSLITNVGGGSTGQPTFSGRRTGGIASTSPNSININGAYGLLPQDTPAGTSYSGAGANTLYGTGGISSTSAGFAAQGYGAGGGASFSTTSNGGDGAPGVCIITQYLS